MRFDWIRAAWNPIYAEAVPQMQTLLSSYDAASAENAITQVMWVYTFHRPLLIPGDLYLILKTGVAGTGVPYDAQDKIYDDLFKRLAAAVTVLKGKTSEQTVW